MKKRQAGNKKAFQPGEKVDSTHPLVGTWEEEPNSPGTTTVLYTVFVKRGKFEVSARDREDGTELKISRVRWDGKALHFKSFYPPNTHTANHALRALSNSKLSHFISGTYADGESFSDREIWRKWHGKEGRRRVP